jgi:glycosyltransferase involved in cell wall biosynthesis
MIRSYAVVTAARDEAENLPRLAACLAAQTVRPQAWYIVENGSADSTVATAAAIAAAHPWVKVMSLPGTTVPNRGAPVVRALQAGIAMITQPPEILVNVDADISIERDYFERLLAKFDADADLGIASGSAFELRNGVWEQRFVTGTTAWGASRAYRWECLQTLLPFEERVAWDGIDEFKANASGWRTKAFEDLPFKHHRREGERDGASWKVRFNDGRTAHYLGYRAWYLIIRSLWHARRGPSALAMIGGYLAAAITRAPRVEDPHARAYLRGQQSLRNLRRRAYEASGRRQQLEAR